MAPVQGTAEVPLRVQRPRISMQLETRPDGCQERCGWVSGCCVETLCLFPLVLHCEDGQLQKPIKLYSQPYLSCTEMSDFHCTLRTSVCSLEAAASQTQARLICWLPCAHSKVYMTCSKGLWRTSLSQLFPAFHFKTTLQSACLHF